MAVGRLSQETKEKTSDGENSGASTVEPKEDGQALASSVAQTLQDVASDVSHKAQDWAANVANKAQETAAAAVDKTNDGMAALGQRMNALGGTVRTTTHQEGAVGSVATTVADTLQAGGRYLEGHGLHAMGKDFAATIRRYPVQSVLISLGLGCLMGMTLRRS
jgi:hypothetical protein